MKGSFPAIVTSIVDTTRLVDVGSFGFRKPKKPRGVESREVTLTTNGPPDCDLDAILGEQVHVVIGRANPLPRLLAVCKELLGEHESERGYNGDPDDDVSDLVREARQLIREFNLPT